MNLALPSYDEMRMSEEEKKVSFKASNQTTALLTEDASKKLEGEICEGVTKKVICKEKKGKAPSVLKGKGKKIPLKSKAGVSDGGNIKVHNITYPQPIPEDAKTNKRYSLLLEYNQLPDQETVIRKKISFGEKGVLERIDGAPRDLLDPHFYRVNLLSRRDTIKDAYIELIGELYK